MTQEKLTQELLSALYRAYQQDTRILLKGEDLERGAIEKFGSEITTAMVTKSFNAFRAGRMIDQLNHPDGSFSIRLNPTGLAAYRANVSSRESAIEKHVERRFKLWHFIIAVLSLLVGIIALVWIKK